MKKLLSLLVCTLILGAPAANAQSSDRPHWSLYTIKGEPLTVALPIVPGMETSKEVRARPQKDRKRRVLKLSASGVVYTIHIVENPKPRLSLEAFIQEQTTANSAEKLTPKGDLTVDGNTGKAFVYPDGNGLAQFFATGDRLYDVRAYGAPLDDPRITTFFHYFSLKKNKRSYEVSENVQSESLSPGETVYTGKEVDTKARLIMKPEPVYTEKARGEQLTGTVVLKCVFAADGTIKNIRVVVGLPFGLTDKSIEAARKIKFIPATKDGKNVSMWMQLEYNYNLY